ncbi:unnamed protein product [Leuciscus chuanchicus]
MGLNVALRGSDSPCKGRLEVRDDKGQWGLVCHFGWKRENGQVVCKSLKCGDEVESGIEMTRYRDLSQPKQYLMDQVDCISNEMSLWNCGFDGANKKVCKDDKQDSFITVQCSGAVKLSLDLNGQSGKCAGVVQYKTSEGRIFGVCESDLDDKKADKICQELGCGNHRHIPKPGLFKVNQSDENVVLNCDAKDQFSWQCMESTKCAERASVICNNYERFRLRGDNNNLCSGILEKYSVTNKAWVPVQKSDITDDICTQLNCGGNFTTDYKNNSLRLTCSADVKLRNFTSTCFGTVSVSVNGFNYGVCYSKSNKGLGEQVCKELGCGGVLSEEEGSVLTEGLLTNVECLGDETSLWHCLAKHEKKRCKPTTVICAGSLDVRLSDGLGRCSGRVELQWGGSWKSINSNGWTNVNSDIVCTHLKCGTSVKKNPLSFTEGKQNQLETRHFMCESSSAKLHECLKKERPLSILPNVQIVCQKEELMFFEGDSCKGRVLVKSFNETEAKANRPVANKTEANDICRATQCGDVAHSFEIQNDTYVSVTCSGSVSVTLRNKNNEQCWGTVEVCQNGKCGGVCNIEKEDSEKICNDLGCGKPIQSQLKNPTQYHGSVTHYSVHCLNEVKKISMCRFIPISGDYCQYPAQVICTGSVKAKLEDPRDKCAGTVSLFYRGKLTPVCHDTLNAELSNAICRELKCGEFIPTTVSRDEFQKAELSKIKCQSDAKSVSECNLEDISDKGSCTAGYIKCTGWKRLLLYKKKDPCSGPVYALSGGKTQPVSAQGWGKEEGQEMCKYLQCGSYITHSNKTKGTVELWNKTYTCSGKTNIWECERDNQPSQGQLNIKCDAKPPPISLSKGCTGEVRINKEENVCSSHLDNHQMHSELCDSLGCGKVFHSWSTEMQKKDCWHFSCTGKETLLWQCGSTKGSCNKILSVTCQKGMEFGSTEKCGGKLAVKYGDRWVYVCGALNEAYKKEVCEVLNCTNGQKLVEIKDVAKEMVTIKCPGEYGNISQCVQVLKEKCTEDLAQIKCEGYKKIESPGNTGLIVGLSLGILGLLIMVFMWMNRRRLLLVLRNYRNKNGKDINIDRNEMKNMEKEDRGGEDADDRSKGSSGTEYDDIEGQNSDISLPQTHADDDLPLLPKRPNNILADQDTYEVEIENKEDYDDVMPVENAGMAETQALVDVAVDAGTGSEAGTGVNADAVVVTTEVEVHAEEE